MMYNLPSLLTPLKNAPYLILKDREFIFFKGKRSIVIHIIGKIPHGIRKEHQPKYAEATSPEVVINGYVCVRLKYDEIRNSK